MKRMLTIGETMAALTPGANGPLRYVRDFRLRIAGAESNVAIGVAKLGGEAAWLSRLGQDELGEFVLAQVRAEGVDCTHVYRDETRQTGLMLKQTGASHTSVFYYRAGSAASALCPQDLQESWAESFSLIHLTGILPVLSASCRALCEAVFELACKNKIPISFDPNVRQKLWQGNDYAPLLRSFAQRSTILLLGREEGFTLYGTAETGRLFARIFEHSAVQLVALKDGDKGSVVVQRGGTPVLLPPVPCDCVETVGAGDAYNAGFLSGWLQGDDLITCGRRGNIAGARATETPGDIEGIPTARQMALALANQCEIER